MDNNTMGLNDKLRKEGRFDKKGNLIQCEYNDKLVKKIKASLNSKEIKLVLTKKGWLARFINDDEIMDAFGTDTIPTAFTASAYPLEVKEVIQRLNPEYIVSFA